MRVITERPGLLASLGPDSFAVYDGRTFLQFRGSHFVPERRTAGPSRPGVLVRVGDELAHFGNDGRLALYPICDGLLCTISEAD